MTIAVRGAVKLRPAALHLDVGLVNPPGPGRCPLPRLGPIGNERRELHHPAVQRGVVNRNAALRHYLLEVSVGHCVVDIEKHRMQDRRLRIMYA